MRRPVKIGRVRTVWMELGKMGEEAPMIRGRRAEERYCAAREERVYRVCLSRGKKK